jgi:DNA polymerase III alpha subunit
MTIFNIELRHQKTDRDAVRQFAPGGESGRLLKPECQARWEREVGVFKHKGLIGPLFELQQLSDRFRDAGHQMQVVGAAASSMVIHAMGLSPICPVKHELYFERFIDPNHETTTPELDFGGMVSMGGLELLQFLRRHEYAIRVFEHEANVNGENTRFETIGVKRTCEPGEGARIILQIAAPSILAIANLLSPGPREDCLDDPTTWELLGSGDTDGIANLEDASTQDMLRSRKPGTLVELATVMVNQGPGRNNEREEQPVYQEELMTLLHQETGIPLREAYEVIRTVAKARPEQVALAKERLLSLAREKGIDETSISVTWEKVQANCRHALCKAHVYATAFHCLQAAYVKAHHPNEFQAVVTAMKN